jgi:predicted Zn-dependent protease
MPGVATATVDEMIATCEQGIYINRFSNVSLIDYETGMLTGVTSNGCFLVRNGKMAAAVRNFRFLDSPFLAFNRIRMLGKSMRAAIGQISSGLWDFDILGGWPPTGDAARWPHVPLIVPAMMIDDFLLTSLADAV